MVIKLMLVSWFKCAEDSINCKFFTVNTTEFAFVYEKKYYLQVYLDNYFNHGFEFQKPLCNICHGLLMVCLINTVKRANCSCFLHDISKSDVTYLLEHSVLDDRWYI